MANASIYVPLSGTKAEGKFIREKVTQHPTYALLLHSNNDDGYQNILDSTVNETAIMKIGNPMHSAIRAKFGNSSIHLDINDHLDIMNTDEFVFGTSNFSIDFWLWPFSGRQVFVLGNPYTDGSIVFDLVDGGSIGYIAAGDSVVSLSIPIGIIAMNMQWYHVAVVRDGNDLRCFIDGNYIGSISLIGVDLTSSGSYSVRIGTGTETSTGSENVDIGLESDIFIDEFRIVVGSSDWIGTDDFIPPTVQY